MNDLSWFLYFADVLPNLSSALGFLLGVSIVFGGIGMVFLTIWTFTSEFESASERVKTFVPKLQKWLVSMFFIMGTLWVLIPSKETIYLIAGSEAGEYVVNTPEAKAILSDIQEVIQLQIEQLKPDDRPTTN